MISFKTLKYYNKELVNKISDLFLFINQGNYLIVDGKIEIDDYLVIVSNNGEINGNVNVIVETIEQDNDFVIIKIEFNRKYEQFQLDNNLTSDPKDDFYDYAVQFFVQINKLELTAQTILAIDYTICPFKEEIKNTSKKEDYDGLNSFLSDCMYNYMNDYKLNME